MGVVKIENIEKAPLFSRRFSGVNLDLLGAEPNLPETAEFFQKTLRNFAETVMRPVGIALDKLSNPDDVVADNSLYWDFRDKYNGLGVSLDAVMQLDPSDLKVVFPLIFEELGWGDAGLASSIGAGLLPAYICALLGRQDLLQKFPDSKIGCWGITEPDHGTDNIDVNRKLFHPEGNYGRSNCTAKISDGKVIIKGQKSAWVSNGPVAEYCLLNCALETESGQDATRGVCVMVPLSSDGVSRGKNIDKIGQRALPQGEIFFDEVTVDIDNLLASPEDYEKIVYMIHTEANGLMGSVFTGVARSAYDLAFCYAHERKQGGVPIIRHQNVARRLFHMARKVEMACALSRRVISYNFGNPNAALQAAMFAKVTSTNTAFEVASEAVQMFGGNGLTREFPVEKIFRDARAAMIEDGCNEVLAIKGGYELIDETLL